jgi:hypothetical protein
MAASTRIAYNPTAVGGIHLANATRYALLAIQEITRAKNMADSITAGGATQANIEGSAEFAASAGQGPTLYSAIVALNTNLAAIPASLISNLDQGG